MAKQTPAVEKPEPTPAERAAFELRIAQGMANSYERALREKIGSIAESLRRRAEEIERAAEYYLDPERSRPLELAENVNHTINWMLPNLGHHDLIGKAAQLEGAQRLVREKEATA